MWNTDASQIEVCVGSEWTRTIVTNNGAYRWSDGSLAASCDEYRNPPSGYQYDNNGSGVSDGDGISLPQGHIQAVQQAP